MRGVIITGILCVVASSLSGAPTDFSSSFPEREYEKEQREKLDDGVGGIMALFLPRKSDATGIFSDPKVANDVSSWFDNIGIMQQVIEDEGFPGLMKLFQELMNGQGSLPGLGNVGGAGGLGGFGSSIGALKGIPGLEKWTNPAGALVPSVKSGDPAPSTGNSAPTQIRLGESANRGPDPPQPRGWGPQNNGNNGRRPNVPPGHDRGSGLRPGTKA